MLYWAVLSFVIAVIAASLGFTGLAVSTVEAAKILFLFFFILFAVSSVFGMVRRPTAKALRMTRK